MGLQSKDQLRELEQQVWENSYLINYLSESDAVQLYTKVHLDLDKFIHENKRNPHEFSFYKDRISLLADLKIYIDKKIQERSEQDQPKPDKQETGNKKLKAKNKVCDVWCYAYYHAILELHDKTKTLPFGEKKKIAEISNGLYEIDGIQFYNQYKKLDRKTVRKAIESLSMKKREELKKAIFELAKIYNSPKHTIWWNTTFI